MIIVQKFTDIATELTSAEFGAFFYNVRNAESGDAYMLYALSGAPKDAFAKFPHPRATEVFGPTLTCMSMATRARSISARLAVARRQRPSSELLSLLRAIASHESTLDRLRYQL